MKELFAILFVLAGFVLAIYLGLFVIFPDGIVDLAHGAIAHPVNRTSILWGGAEAFVLAEAIGVGIFYVFVLVAEAIFGD